MSTFNGKIIEFTIFGESHGNYVGIHMSGLPKSFVPDLEGLKSFMDRRRPGKSTDVSGRNEDDEVFFEREPKNGEFTAIIKNKDKKSEDYENTKYVPRPGTADYAQFLKDGEIRPGGGRFSGRMTAPLCIGGFFAISLLKEMGIEIETTIVRLGGKSKKEEMQEALEYAKSTGDSIGGVVKCKVIGMKKGVGEFLSNGLESKISNLVFGIPGVKGIEFGSGFSGADKRGSENNDSCYFDKGKLCFETNNAGGILGGVSTGEPIEFYVAFKPTPSIKLQQSSVNLSTKENVTLKINGRHDPCIALRAMPVVEAATAIALSDEIMVSETMSPREQIDVIDRRISELLEKRYEICDQIGKGKIKENIPVYNSERESEVIENVKNNKKHSAQIEKVYREIMSQSRFLQESHKFLASGDCKKAGLLGAKLSHSISPEIHKELATYEYDILERSLDELEKTVKLSDYQCFNVTIPYKKDVYRMCDEVSEISKIAGAVNTVVRKGGKLFGYNTDYFGFGVLLKINGIDVAGKKVLVLGSGGASGAVTYNLKKMGATVSVVSRSGELNYENVYHERQDTEIIVNTTPVGMMPKEGTSPIEVKKFDKLTTVIDVIYNPGKTKLLMDAKLCGMKIVNGLSMLVAQAVLSSKIFTGEYETDNIENPEELLDTIYRVVSKFIDERNNIVLIGMPGSGKTTIGRELGKSTGRVFVDLDVEFTRKYGITPKVAIKELGEDEFRRRETEVIKSVHNIRQAIIATGGGVVEREENYYLLAENSIMCLVETPKEMIATHGRPLSLSMGVERLLQRREKIYKTWADSGINIKL